MSNFLVKGHFNNMKKMLRLLSTNRLNTRFLSSQTLTKEKITTGDVTFRKGNLYHGFVCTDIQDIKEFNMTALMFQHEKTNTEYLHLQRDDSNNVFSINFRTTPFNSTGLPHILEHTVLCGSKKYPVRDPFFKMLNRSLATFMNAMTGPDFTFYPFSSQNEVDYRNLQKIYLDAVFQPNLNNLDFLQEGWRLEFSDINDLNSKLNFKGVVFNEMKGAFSENGAIFGQKFFNTILPSHTYGYVSGGDPLKIPDLTVEELRNFHKKYYHPSNSKIYSYGNFPVERNLEICNQLYLSDCDGIDSSYSKVPSETRWSSPIEKNVSCRYDKMGAPIEKQNQIAIGYLMSDINNVYDTFVLQVLSELMVSGPNSEFYKSLIEPNISGGYNQITGFDSQIKDTMFVVGLRDLEVNKFEMVKQIFDETINKIIQGGFNETHVESVLHGIELGIKHQSTNFGLSTLFNISPLWNHGGNIAEALQVGPILDRFKSNLKDPKYLQKMVEKNFSSNKHKLIMTMTPDVEYENKLEKAETDLLHNIVSKLGENDKQRIFQEGLQLAESQKTQENIELLPCLSLNDIIKKLPDINVHKTRIESIPTQTCSANTNNVTYFKSILDTSVLENDLKSFIPIFNLTACKVGTKKYNYRDLDQLINLKTGGVNFSTHIADQVNNTGKYEQGISLSSYCLDHNIDGMFSILSEIFQKPTYKDVDRFKMLFDSYVSSLTPGIASSGHLYAMQCANGIINSGNLLREQLSGIKHVKYIKNISKTVPIEDVMQKISTISNQVLHGSRMRIAINFSHNSEKDVLTKFGNFAKNVEKNDHKHAHSMILTDDIKLKNDFNCIHHVANFSVNYCAKAVAVVPFSHEDFCKLRVLSKFISAKYLHPVVREQNGAYGGGARISQNGLFTFYSYRDPNSTVTLDVFDNVSKWLKECTKDVFNEQSLFESKLSILQQLDAPVAEYNKGIEEFTYGLNCDTLAKHRNDILNVTLDDLVEVCERYLHDDKTGRVLSSKCIIGPGVPESVLTTRDGEKWDILQPTSDE